MTFSNVDWRCDSFAKHGEKNARGQVLVSPAHVTCYRLSKLAKSGIDGVWTLVSPWNVLVLRCTPHVLDCPRLGKFPRNP